MNDHDTSNRKDQRARSIGLSVIVMLLMIVWSPFSLSGQTFATAVSGAEIFGAATITWVDDLSFGEVGSPSVNGTVIIQSSGVNDDTTWTTGGTLTILGGTVKPARFTVSTSKAKGNRFWIELPDSISIVEPGSGASMVVDQFNANVNSLCITDTHPGDAVLLSQCPQATPTYDLVVGATLNVSANQTIGIYAGSFLVKAHTN